MRHPATLVGCRKRICDPIFRMHVVDDNPAPVRVFIGEGAYAPALIFSPSDKGIIYASRYLGGATCPPKPDRSQGYVWPLYDSYDIFRTSTGGAPLRLISEPGY